MNPDEQLKADRIRYHNLRIQDSIKDRDRAGEVRHRKALAALEGHEYPPPKEAEMKSPDTRPDDLMPVASERWDAIVRAENELEMAGYDLAQSRYAEAQHFHKHGSKSNDEWQALVTAHANNVRAFDLAMAKVNLAHREFRAYCKAFHQGTEV